LSFSSLDIVSVALVVLCVMLGLLRGIWRELISVAVVVGAAGAAWYFADSAAGQFGFLSDPALRRVLGFIAVFIGAYAIAAIGAFALRLLLGSTPPGGKARMAGAVAGFARAIGIIVLGLFLATLTSAPRQAWWRDSLTVRLARPATTWLRAQLPADIARHFARG
jgi:membrane protein required for colicin V production